MKYKVRVLIIRGEYFSSMSGHWDIYLSDKLQKAKFIDPFFKDLILSMPVWINGEKVRLTEKEVEVKHYYVEYTEV